MARKEGKHGGRRLGRDVFLGSSNKLCKTRGVRGKDVVTNNMKEYRIIRLIPDTMDSMS